MTPEATNALIYMLGQVGASTPSRIPALNTVGSVMAQTAQSGQYKNQAAKDMADWKKLADAAAADPNQPDVSSNTKVDGTGAKITYTVTKPAGEAAASEGATAGELFPRVTETKIPSPLEEIVNRLRAGATPAAPTAQTPAPSTINPAAAALGGAAVPFEQTPSTVQTNDGGRGQLSELLSMVGMTPELMIQSGNQAQNAAQLLAGISENRAKAAAASAEHQDTVVNNLIGRLLETRRIENEEANQDPFKNVNAYAERLKTDPTGASLFATEKGLIPDKPTSQREYEAAAEDPEFKKIFSSFGDYTRVLSLPENMRAWQEERRTGGTKQSYTNWIQSNARAGATKISLGEKLTEKAAMNEEEKYAHYSGSGYDKELAKKLEDNMEYLVAQAEGDATKAAQAKRNLITQDLNAVYGSTRVKYGKNPSTGQIGWWLADKDGKNVRLLRGE